jgi:hypothetical protein
MTVGLDVDGAAVSFEDLMLQRSPPHGLPIDTATLHQQFPLAGRLEPQSCATVLPTRTGKRILVRNAMTSRLWRTLRVRWLISNPSTCARFDALVRERLGADPKCGSLLPALENRKRNSKRYLRQEWIRHSL